MLNKKWYSSEDAQEDTGPDSLRDFLHDTPQHAAGQIAQAIWGYADSCEKSDILRYRF